jgi:hypothetical protein
VSVNSLSDSVARIERIHDALEDGGAYFAEAAVDGLLNDMLAAIEAAEDAA